MSKTMNQEERSEQYYKLAKEKANSPTLKGSSAENAYILGFMEAVALLFTEEHMLAMKNRKVKEVITVTDKGLEGLI